MVLLTTTPRILSALSSLPPPSISTLTSTTTTPDTPLPSTTGAPISHTTLILLSKILKSSSSPSITNYTLNDLLRSTHPYTPPLPPPPAKTAQYTALMARLRADQERREYLSLTQRQVQGFGSIQDAFAENEKDDVTPSLVFNVLLSVVMCGVATWHITRYWRNDGVRVLVSLLVAVVVGVAEVVVYAGYLRKVRESKEKERRIKERKVVVGSEEIVGGKGSAEVDVDEKESEEIWGRGKHGGMRRRVREKWEKEKGQGDGAQE